MTVKAWTLRILVVSLAMLLYVGNVKSAPRGRNEIKEDLKGIEDRLSYLDRELNRIGERYPVVEKELPGVDDKYNAAVEDINKLNKICADGTARLEARWDILKKKAADYINKFDKAHAEEIEKLAANCDDLEKRIDKHKQKHAGEVEKLEKDLDAVMANIEKFDEEHQHPLFQISGEIMDEKEKDYIVVFGRAIPEKGGKENIFGAHYKEANLIVVNYHRDCIQIYTNKYNSHHYFLGKSDDVLKNKYGTMIPGWVYGDLPSDASAEKNLRWKLCDSMNELKKELSEKKGEPKQEIIELTKLRDALKRLKLERDELNNEQEELLKIEYEKERELLKKPELERDALKEKRCYLERKQEELKIELGTLEKDKYVYEQERELKKLRLADVWRETFERSVLDLADAIENRKQGWLKVRENFEQMLTRLGKCTEMLLEARKQRGISSNVLKGRIEQAEVGVKKPLDALASALPKFELEDSKNREGLEMLKQQNSVKNYEALEKIEGVIDDIITKTNRQADICNKYEKVIKEIEEKTNQTVSP